MSWTAKIARRSCIQIIATSILENGQRAHFFYECE